MDILR